MLAVGETCQFKLRANEPLEGRDRWSEGTYIPRDRDNGQHIIVGGESGEVSRARTILRIPNSQSWNKGSIASIRVTPFELHVPKEQTATLRDDVDKTDDTASDIVRVVRWYRSELRILQCMVTPTGADVAATSSDMAPSRPPSLIRNLVEGASTRSWLRRLW